jgi:hypothetical protein
MDSGPARFYCDSVIKQWNSGTNYGMINNLLGINEFFSGFYFFVKTFGVIYHVSLHFLSPFECKSQDKVERKRE